MQSWRQEFITRHSFDNILKSDRESAKGIVERFKKQNPSLMELNPEVGIDQYTIDADGNPCKFLIVFVGHRFIFDYRLIPTHFEGLRVKSNLCDKMPKEFPQPFPGMQIEEYDSPIRYRLFVDRNIETIRKSLISANMSVDEALDALTGGWKKHESWAKNTKKERIMEHKEHIEFFKKLSEQTKESYYKSDVFKKYGAKNWGYSITATSFEKNAKVIVGFNWGVDSKLSIQEKSHGAQEEYPLKNFPSSYEDLGSFKRTINLFFRYFEIIPEVQINYCFFRSEKESQITPIDLKLSAKLFDDLIQYLEPSMLISFSSSLNEYFEKEDRLISKNTLTIKSGNKSFSVIKGKVKVFKKEIDYYNLPHPNYPITKEAREKAWDFCFKDLTN